MSRQPSNEPCAEHTVIVALGSNVGRPAENVTRAIEQLRRLAPGPFLASSLWQTDPVDCPPGSPPFTNAIVLFTANDQETPESLFGRLQEMERQFGRQPKVLLNEPRPLDLDLIVFGKQARNTKTLILPHPRAHLRKFVLGPLAEIAPALVLPGQTRTVAELLRNLPE